MAISRELKAYINRAYDDKIATEKARANKEIDKINDRYNEILENTFNTQFLTELQAIQQKLSAFKEEANLSLTVEGRYLLDIKMFRDFCYRGNSAKADAIKAILAERTKELNRERERLLIQLSLEKDFDNVNAILSLHNIEL